jgi:hypothetical protein
MLIEIVISRRAHDDDDDVTVECYSTTTTVSTVVPRVSCSRGLARGVVKLSWRKFRERVHPWRKSRTGCSLITENVFTIG